MNQNHSANHSEALALERFAMMTKIQDSLRQGIPLRQALLMASLVPFHRPDGATRSYSVRTLEDWWYVFKKGGFAELHPQTRSDKGKARAFTPAQVETILQQARSTPLVPLKNLYRQWKQKDPNLPSLSSVYRLLQVHHLNPDQRRSLGLQPFSGPTKAFEAPFANDLWMVDFSPGPFLQITPKPAGTHLCLLIDDHSRLIPFAAYYLAADTRCFHQTFKQALRRRGLPHKLYTDQGGPFINDHTKLICANLGVRLLHAKPYHAWSKGKVERLFRTIQEDFEALLRLPGQGVSSLEELNARFSRWVQETYHTRLHSSTGMSPEQRFKLHSHLLRCLPPDTDLDRLFYFKDHRLVRKDGTIRIDNHFYEVDLALRHLKVEIRFDPYSMQEIEVYLNGQRFGLARKVDLHLNSQINPRQNHA